MGKTYCILVKDVNFLKLLHILSTDLWRNENNFSLQRLVDRFRLFQLLRPKSKWFELCDFWESYLWDFERIFVVEREHSRFKSVLFVRVLANDFTGFWSLEGTDIRSESISCFSWSVFVQNTGVFFYCILKIGYKVV